MNEELNKKRGEITPRTPEAEKVHKEFLKRCAVGLQRERIWQGLVKILDRETNQREGRIQGVTVRNILSCINKEGGVLKVNRELPDCDYEDKSTGKRYALIDGMYTHIAEPEKVAVEPLIES